jgi:hypothetical protein
MLEDGFHFIYPDGSYHQFDAKLDRIVENSQNPVHAAEMSFTCSKEVPMPPLIEVVFVRDGQHIFHGIVWTAQDNDTTWRVECKSMEYVLGWRYLAPLIYHEVSLDDLLSSGEPSLSTDIPGILWRANSEIPNGKWTAYSATVAKLADGGTKSQMGSGTLFAYTTYPQATSIDSCDGVNSLSDAGTYPTTANKYYRTADDLYVRLGDGSYLPNAFLVAASNKFDTKIRYKSCDIGTYKTTVDWSPFGAVNAVLSDIFEKSGREAQFLPHTDGYLYLTLAEKIERGSETAPIKRFVDGQDGCTVSLTTDIDPRYQAVIGLPNDFSGTAQVVTDWNPSRIQLWRLYDVACATNDEKRDRIQYIIDGQDDGLKITAPVDYHLRVGDWISATHSEFGEYIVRIQKITKAEPTMTIQAGKVVFVASDAFGEYLRATVPDDSDCLSETTIAYPASGSFVIKKEDVADGLVIYYEESYNVDADDTAIDEGTFLDLEVGATAGTTKVIPPGRIILKNGASVKIDITDYCTKSASADTTNYISRNLYKATGWTGSDARITQWKALKFLAP